MSELNEVIEVQSIDRKNYKQYIGKTVTVGGDFFCENNELASLEGAPETLVSGAPPS